MQFGIALRPYFPEPELSLSIVDLLKTGIAGAVQYSPYFVGVDIETEMIAHHLQSRKQLRFGPFLAFVHQVNGISLVYDSLHLSGIVPEIARQLPKVRQKRLMIIAGQRMKQYFLQT